MRLLLSYLFLLALAAAPLAAAPAAKKDSTARRVLSYSQFVKEMVECTGAVYRLENADLVYDKNTDTAFVNFREANGGAISMEGERKFFLPQYNVKCAVLLKNVKINYSDKYFGSIVFYNFQFNAGFLADNFNGGLEFTDCTFPNFIDGGCSIWNSSSEVSYCFFRCKFLKDFSIISSKIQRLVIRECTIGFSDVTISNNQIEEIDFGSDTLIGRTRLRFGKNNLTNVSLDSCICPHIAFQSTVQREFTISNCKFDSIAYFYAAQFPHKNTSLAFNQITQKIVVEDAVSYALSYRARTDTELANQASYNNLISIYTDFLSLYKTRGDQESYNACYVEMKQIHTRRAGYLYRKAPALETWFDWRLNQLLDVFSDYGTNSAKGLIYIFYVIIGFAALYLVFPSEADNLSRANSFRMFDLVIGYFSTNSTLVNLSKHKQQRARDDVQNFRTTLDVSRADVPAFIAWLGAPLYGLNRAYLGFSAWLVERFDIVPGRWNELSAGRKAWTGAAVGAYMLGFLLWGVVMRLVNAFALSINAFVTLGYGEIQARGVARYLAVMEGAIGWFLLSIFSVSLISQLLQ
jgi:uncharacterized membrane protein YuzA (DUF378 family)